MNARVEMEGKKYGMLSVVERVGKRGQYFLWKCVCDCGNEVVRAQPALRFGGTLSCGCRKKIPNSGHFKATHGHSDKSYEGRCSKEYGTWATIKARTENPKAHGYERYGGAGIFICKEWSESFERFLEYVGNAPSKNHTIDRIESNKGYEPGNVKWATYAEQNRHRICTVFVEIDGINKSLGEWCQQYGMPFKNAYMRILKYGWDPLRALQTPVRKEKK